MNMTKSQSILHYLPLLTQSLAQSAKFYSQRNVSNACMELQTFRRSNSSVLLTATGDSLYNTIVTLRHILYTYGIPEMTHMSTIMTQNTISQTDECSKLGSQ